MSRFLLTALQMDRIFATRTVKEIKSALTSMPVSWITHARRPLLVGELRHGLAVEYRDDGEGLQEFDEDNLLSPGSLVDVCTGLVIIDSTSQIIRLVHYTTQEYFDNARLHLFKGAEIDMSRARLTYLSCSWDTKLRIVEEPFFDFPHNKEIFHEAF